MLVCFSKVQSHALHVYFDVEQPLHVTLLCNCSPIDNLQFKVPEPLRLI